MDTIIDALREVLGTPDFYKQMGSGSYNNYTWDYGAMLEYFVAAIILMIVVSSVFKLVRKIFFD